MNESITLSTPFPLPFWVFATLLLGFFFALLWAALPVLMRRPSPKWPLATPELNLILSIVVVLGALLFVGAVISAFAILQHTFQAASGSGDGPNLGAGALIAALLGAPFVIWGTVLKYQTVRYQKEGHMTDRISKAVEQLGAEKKVDRIGRPVTIWTGRPRRFTRFVSDGHEVSLGDRELILGSKYSNPWDHESGDEISGRDFDICSWPEEKTEIEWQGHAFSIRNDEHIAARGSWEVFSETIPNLEVRIGAILSLERIAQDSTIHDKGRDHVRAMEILCAYVRNNSPIMHRNPSTEPFETKRPRLDIQVSIDVIKRRSSEQKALEAVVKYRLDLREVDFDGVNMSHGDFAGAILFRGRFEATNFYSTQLRGARFNGIFLNYPDFRNSDLRGAVFNGATINKMQFGGFGTSKDCKIFVEAAKLNGINFTNQNHLNYYGSLDTIVDRDYQKAKEAAAEHANDMMFRNIESVDSNENGNELTSQYSYEDMQKSKFFLHWNPYTEFDFASVESRTRYREQHGLIGWPYED